MTPPLRLFVMESPLEREGNSFAVLGRLPLTEYAAVVYNPGHKSSARARIPIFATQQIDRGDMPCGQVQPVRTSLWSPPATSWTH